MCVWQGWLNEFTCKAGDGWTAEPKLCDVPFVIADWLLIGAVTNGVECAVLEVGGNVVDANPLANGVVGCVWLGERDFW